MRVDIMYNILQRPQKKNHYVPKLINDIESQNMYHENIIYDYTIYCQHQQ